MTQQPRNTLARFFAGLTESTFQSQLGVADPRLVDYLSQMLMRFVRSDSLHKVRNLTGRKLTDVGQMVSEANQRVGSARREVHRHIGDFTLFWTGLFPEALRRQGPRAKIDFFTDYCKQGKRAYLIASTIQADDEEEAANDLLERLGHEFELCAYGLREVRREWERQDEADDDKPKPILID